eukprot:TRINITY_DN2080_c0_g1_i1.p3 TRINITY_DN2080_c0_g1~~TRINITY_DN2080_c0_g1_i1.p3  ORF type:complete len:142 (+),score=10.00 TRINITY_DN2080_c0_g1_i1:751-1176(+)
MQILLVSSAKSSKVSTSLDYMLMLNETTSKIVANNEQTIDMALYQAIMDLLNIEIDISSLQLEQLLQLLDIGSKYSVTKNDFRRQNIKMSQERLMQNEYNFKIFFQMVLESEDESFESLNDEEVTLFKGILAGTDDNILKA